MKSRYLMKYSPTFKAAPRYFYAKFWLLLTLVSQFSTLSANEQKHILVGTGDGPPFIRTENGSIHNEKPGLSIEILQSIAKHNNWKLEFVEMPFARQIVATRLGEVDAMVAVFKMDAPDLLYPSTPIAVAEHCFFTREDTDFWFTSLQDLDAIKLGVINDYNYGLIDEYVAENKQDNILRVSGQDKDSLTKLLALLHMRRIDAFIEAKSVVEYVTNNLDTETLRIAGCTAISPAYIAFSPASEESEQLAHEFDSAIEQLRTQGELKRLFQKYGITDWHK